MTRRVTVIVLVLAAFFGALFAIWYFADLFLAQLERFP